MYCSYLLVHIYDTVQHTKRYRRRYDLSSLAMLMNQQKKNPRPLPKKKPQTNKNGGQNSPKVLTYKTALRTQNTHTPK